VNSGSQVNLYYAFLLYSFKSIVKLREKKEGRNGLWIVLRVFKQKRAKS
jgi:hypothetical protein